MKQSLVAQASCLCKFPSQAAISLHCSLSTHPMSAAIACGFGLMVKVTLGGKGKRWKWNFYFFGILLIVILTTCHILIRLDWSSVQRSAFKRALLDIEEQAVLGQNSVEAKVHRLFAQCNEQLRARGMAGYLCELSTGKYYFLGRTSAAFRKAIEAQKALIDAGKPFDEKSIPKLRVVVDFEKLNCRLVVADIDRPGAPNP